MEFEPVYKDYVWGGHRIAKRFDRSPPVDLVAESWEVSAHPDGLSKITGSSKTLLDLDLNTLLGKPCERFPLLVKIIDAHANLSVQVHPSTGVEAKTEAWHVIDANEEACVWAGFKRPMTPELIRESLENHTIENYLTKIPVKAGDTIFIPGGRVHAIGAGCLILEVQQTSNTTYRLYDWGRPRELHIEKALEVINFENIDNPLQSLPLHTPFFNLSKFTGPSKRTGFEIVFNLDTGKTILLPHEDTQEFPSGNYFSIKL
ncbi:MAG: putative mannose-6-phosphate isomerase GmuF [Chlamydiia bacterium]|nr:putative mannose-6-phosphate isomerase GmuF [Chlamydiia bacterium]MCH9616470.1 putative mannose-6-phosphate isomerase GmuF [Chlamydiia bacterium]MCH9629544.1 putative mannose-6-phosphate isomerase GmuF [Chlamydiia bacterium]